MNYNELQHGDVLLFERRRHQGFLVSAIRLITGSRFTHAAVVQVLSDGTKVVLEQLSERTHSLVELYYSNPWKSERIHVFRPRFPVPPVTSTEDFIRFPYGYAGIMDCALNHFLGVLSLYNWSHRPILARLVSKQHMICSALVAKRLNLASNCKWVEHPGCVEPDDYSLHPESFESFGTLEWS